ncbi:hypothetical protein OQA88_2233 [Cercophora sp. LCS_1]
MNHHLTYPSQVPDDRNLHISSYHAEPSPPYTTPDSSPSFGDQFEVSPPKRQRLASPGTTITRPRKSSVKRIPRTMTPAPESSRRGITPEDGNIQTQQTKATSTPSTMGFRDESRSIASEYQGGLGRYPPLSEKDTTPPRVPTADSVMERQPVAMNTGRELGPAAFQPSQRSWQHPAPQPTPVYDEAMMHAHRNSEPFPPSATAGPQLSHASVAGAGMSFDQYANREDGFRRPHVSRPNDFATFASPSFTPGIDTTPQTHHSSGLATPQVSSVSDGLMTPPNERAGGEREYLSEEDDIRFMQAYVDDVSGWMEILDKDKHFSKAIPILALKSPMLLNALLACGAKQVARMNKQSDDKAHVYYDNSTKQLLACLKDPDRDMAECATTAAILNVYEIMGDKPNQRMSHIAGARALIRECDWDASTPGIGGACFWLNIGLEIFSCLSFNWQTAWEPDNWGLDLGFTEWAPTPRTNASDDDGDGMLRANDGDEELWVQRMFYIVAKITNFRASIPRFQEPSPHDEQIRRQGRFNEWKKLKGLCDAWNSNCPRSMQPYAYSHTTKSLFPRVWLIKRPAILGRLFYHTALCLLAQINPMESCDSEDNRVSQEFHAQHTCGILAHTNDHAVMSGAIRCLAVAGAALGKREEQAEALAILDRVERETGWKLDKVCAQLRSDWGWETGSRTLPKPGRTSSNPGPPPNFFSTSAVSTPGSLAAPTPTRPNINPLLINADFSNQNHPYQTFYEPPNKSARVHSHST